MRLESLVTSNGSLTMVTVVSPVGSHVYVRREYDRTVPVRVPGVGTLSREPGTRRRVRLESKA